jgi:hypothetical protein
MSTTTGAGGDQTPEAQMGLRGAAGLDREAVRRRRHPVLQEDPRHPEAGGETRGRGRGGWSI